MRSDEKINALERGENACALDHRADVRRRVEVAGVDVAPVGKIDARLGANEEARGAQSTFGMTTFPASGKSPEIRPTPSPSKARRSIKISAGFMRD